ncbi:hypothetical protein GCM10027347_21150 [Larkinella harenae]
MITPVNKIMKMLVFVGVLVFLGVIHPTIPLYNVPCSFFTFTDLLRLAAHGIRTIDTPAGTGGIG